MLAFFYKIINPTPKLSDMKSNHIKTEPHQANIKEPAFQLQRKYSLPSPQLADTQKTNNSQLPTHFWNTMAYCPCTLSSYHLKHKPSCKEAIHDSPDIPKKRRRLTL